LDRLEYDKFLGMDLSSEFLKLGSRTAECFFNLQVDEYHLFNIYIDRDKYLRLCGTFSYGFL
jgi:hypothetical protein